MTNCWGVSDLGAEKTVLNVNFIDKVLGGFVLLSKSKLLEQVLVKAPLEEFPGAVVVPKMHKQVSSTVVESTAKVTGVHHALSDNIVEG